jgi:branched-subunit amino acid transport protein
MNIYFIRYSLIAALIFSILFLIKEPHNKTVSDPWFLPVIVAVLWISYK